MINILNFFKKNKLLIILLAITALGACLRSFNFHDLVRFNDDQARDAQIVNNMIEKNDYPLLGPKAGGTKFNLGPAFYYIEYISALLFGNNPAGIATIILLLSIASIPLLFFFLRFYFSEKISFFTVFLYALSFFAIKYSKFSWNPNAIPFFLLIFFIAYYKIGFTPKKPAQKIFWYLLLGISMGIGTQLHTLLLILLPALAIIDLMRAFFAKNKEKARGILAALAIGLICNLPLIIYDLKNDGENAKSFFQGTTQKAGDSFARGKNLLKNFNFFANGNAYVLSGYEPQKNWLDSKNYFSFENSKEIFASIAGMLFFLSGFLLNIFLLRQEKQRNEKKFLEIILLSLGASFLIFWPLAGDLKARFFIVCFIYPFIFLALWLSFISAKMKNKNFQRLLFIAIAIILAYTNSSTYKKAYDFKLYADKGDIYGGISLGEAEKISAFIIESSKADNLSDKKFHLLPFKFNKSIKYLNKKSNLNTPLESFASAKEVSDNAILVWLGKSKNFTRIPDKKEFFTYNLLEAREIGRFAVFLFKKKSPEKPVKIGFITDVHARRTKKENGDLNVSSRAGLENFITHMNTRFHPDFSMQNGDLIDGTKRKGQASIDDFELVKKYFQKLNAPFYHVNGNHDMRGLTRNEWLKLTNNEKTYYFFDYKGLRIFILDGNENEKISREKFIDGDPYSYIMTNEQLTWLENELGNSKKMKKTVFIHYPPISKNADRILNPEIAKKLQKLFSEHNVAAVFSGHTEILDYTELNGVQYFTLQGLDKSKNKNIHWLDSFAEISVAEDVSAMLYYKKNREENYQTLRIPSEEYDKIEK